jgi:hypothetical protein
METNVLGNKATRKQAAIRKVLSGEIVECDCGMVEADKLGKVDMTSEVAGRKV